MISTLHLILKCFISSDAYVSKNVKRNYFYISHTKKEINRVFYLQASVSNSKKNKDTEDIMNFPLIYGHLFSNKKKINTILAISSSCYFTRWKERSQDEISFSIFSEMTLFEKRVLKVSKFNSCRIYDKEYWKNCNKCLF